uniref:Uncharacterized protein n=1 Tax=Arundo donax TaxID=35708 RepID=A0A0A8Y702_ARUDO
MEFKDNIIVSGKFMDRQEIFCSIRYMKNIIQKQGLLRSENAGMTNVGNGHT